MSRVMKDSGISYIGNIPENWVTSLFKWGIVHIKTGLNPRDNFKLDKESPNFYVTIKNFKNGELFLDDKCDNMDDEAREIIHERSDIKKGDILFASISKDGQAYLIKEEPTNRDINESVFTIRVNEDYFLNKYFYYYIINNSFFNNLLIGATGTTFLSIKQNDILNSYVTIPPLSEQQKIADFLDKKCSKIDEQKANYEKSIELLKEYKQSLITKAVTKGINPNCKLKDSGIDWIGEIPEDWEVRRIKYTGDYRNGLTYSPNDLCGEEGTLVLRSSNIQGGKLDFEDNVYVSCEIDKNLIVKDGDILICSRNGSQKLIGKNAIIENLENTSFGAFMMIYRSEYNPKYMYYILNSYIFEYYKGMFLTTTVNQLTGGNFGNMKTPFCTNIEEQQQIVEYLDKECSKIDKVIFYREQMIEKLEEYKKSLIYESVTGKKEIK